MTDFNIEHVFCCVCCGTGKTRQGLFRRLKDCPVCDGRGERPILIHKNITGADAAMVRASAITGCSLNYARPSLWYQITGL